MSPPQSTVVGATEAAISLNRMAVDVSVDGDLGDFPPGTGSGVSTAASSALLLLPGGSTSPVLPLQQGAGHHGQQMPQMLPQMMPFNMANMPASVPMQISLLQQMNGMHMQANGMQMNGMNGMPTQAFQIPGCFGPLPVPRQSARAGQYDDFSGGSKMDQVDLQFFDRELGAR